MIEQKEKKKQKITNQENKAIPVHDTLHTTRKKRGTLIMVPDTQKTENRTTPPVSASE